MPVFGQVFAAPAGLAVAGRCGEPLEQRQLRVAVRLPRPVELQVLVGQVRQDRDVVLDRPNPPEGQPVRRGLEDRGLVTGQDHRSERGLEHRGLRRGGVDLVRCLQPADPCRGGAGHPGPDPGRLERRGGQEAGRRLAVRAGHAEDRQVVARVAVPPARSRRERGRRGIDDELGQVRLRHGVLDERRCRAPCRGLHDELVSIHVQSGHGHEQRSVPDRARILGHATDQEIGEPRRADRTAVAPCPAEPTLGAKSLDQRREACRVGWFRGADPLGDRIRRSSPHHACEPIGHPAERVPSAGRTRARGRR